MGSRPDDRDLSRLAPAVVLTIALAVVGIWLIRSDLQGPSAPPEVGRPAPGAPRSQPAEGYLFCTWNVENLFDDQDDPHNHDADEDWFARHPEAVREKVDLLARALLLQNDGKGPDILAVVEVENRRAVELLRDALNASLPTEWQYDGLIHRDNVSGRRIEPAVLTRLAVRDDLTRTFGPRRILEAHVESQGAPLIVLVSHWTSRLREETEEKRGAYADALYEAVLENTRSNPAADILLSGDFNDEPDDPSLVDHLHTSGDAERVRSEFDRNGR